MSASDFCPCCRGKLTRSRVAPPLAARGGRSSSTRCKHCGAAVGEPNRCPRCLALMAVIERSGAYHCGACGSPRERSLQTVCLTDAELLRALEAGSVRAQRWLAFVPTALLTCVALLMTEGELAVRMMIGAVGLLASVGLLARTLRRERGRARRRTFEIEQRIIGLAYQNDGVLREDEVSRRLRISLVEARAVLEELARQDRAVAYGHAREPIEFRFGEARRTRAIRRRSAPSARQDQSS